MIFPDEIQTETPQEEALMVALHESDFGESFVKELEKHLNLIGMNGEMNDAEKIALAAYILIELMGAMEVDNIRPELLLKALDEASNFDKVIKKTSAEGEGKR